MAKNMLQPTYSRLFSLYMRLHRSDKSLHFLVFYGASKSVIAISKPTWTQILYKLSAASTTELNFFSPHFGMSQNMF